MYFKTSADQWRELKKPKPNWEVFKQMLGLCSNDPDLVLETWRLKQQKKVNVSRVRRD